MSDDKPKLDFTFFHPSDHWPWEPRCREFYGGWRYHLHVAWQYRWKSEIIWYARRPFQWLLLCRIGRHAWQTWHRRDRGYRTVCESCPATRETREDEKFELPPPHIGGRE